MKIIFLGLRGWRIFNVEKKMCTQTPTKISAEHTDAVYEVLPDFDT